MNFGVKRVDDEDQGRKKPRRGEIFCSHPSFGICGIVGLATEGVGAGVSKVRGGSVNLAWDLFCITRDSRVS